ncbi:hypothetical protein [uncultured Chryseobacterium sp.]|uniref:hypothetical protein n=1 Tax=uncultured Chryseobacterium sp. TaxID=259322 RepID=UPI0025F5ACB9|nr:hypothetical protein [uncultured Chryseobacterium sp.]
MRINSVFVCEASDQSYSTLCIFKRNIGCGPALLRKPVNKLECSNTLRLQPAGSGSALFSQFDMGIPPPLITRIAVPLECSGRWTISLGIETPVTEPLLLMISEPLDPP